MPPNAERFIGYPLQTVLLAGTAPDRAIGIQVLGLYGKPNGNLTRIMLGQHSPVWSILLTFEK
jgi:hypothetical protein